MKAKFFFSAVAVVAAATCLTGCSSKTTIDFKDTVSVKYFGYNGEGTASPQNDYNYILSMLGDMNSMTAAGLVSSFTFEEVENNGELSNGDVITVTINANEEMLKNAKVNVENTELEFIVEGLEEKPTIDVFADVSLKVSGSSPYCTVSAEYNSSEHSLSSYSFDITSADGEEKENYKDGDVVTVTLTENARQSLESSYIVKEFSQNFVVQADSKYIMSADDLGGNTSDLEIIATDFTEDAVHNTKGARVKVLSGISGVNEGKIYASSWKLDINDLKFNSAYAGVSSKAGIFGTTTYTQCIYFFYNAEADYWVSNFPKAKEGSANGIIAVKMNNPIISADGKITYDEIGVVSSALSFDDYSSTLENCEKLF